MPPENVESVGKIKSPLMSSWDNTHPVIKSNIDFSNLLIDECMNLKFPEGAGILLRSTKGPVIGIYNRKSKVNLVVGFNIFRSNWPGQISFVMFLHQAINHFESLQSLDKRLNLLVGKSISIPLQEQAPKITTPAGDSFEMSNINDIEYSFSDVQKCGIYEIEFTADFKKSVAVNLFSYNESNIEAMDNPIENQNIIKGEAAGIFSKKDIFKILLMVALGFLFLEWIIFHRRILT